MSVVDFKSALDGERELGNCTYLFYYWLYPSTIWIIYHHILDDKNFQSRFSVSILRNAIYKKLLRNIKGWRGVDSSVREENSESGKERCSENVLSLGKNEWWGWILTINNDMTDRNTLLTFDVGGQLQWCAPVVLFWRLIVKIYSLKRNVVHKL